MTVTDIAILILSIFFLSRGASRGFMNSLTGPLSVIITTVLSILYYQATKDAIISLLIGLIGPLLLNILFKLLIKKWARATNTQIKPSFLSCLGGAGLTLAWGWVFIIFTLILLTVVPPWGEKLTAIHNDVAKSTSFQTIAKPFKNIILGASNQNTTAVTSEDSNNDAKSLAEDPRFQKLVQDPDIQKEIDTHDIGKLMSNPKMMALVQQVMSDPATMKKVMAIYSSQAEPPAAKNP